MLNTPRITKIPRTKKNQVLPIVAGGQVKVHYNN